MEKQGLTIKIHKKAMHYNAIKRLVFTNQSIGAKCETKDGIKDK